MNEKKMLHERLRNLTIEDCSGKVLADAVEGAEADCSVDCRECVNGVMKALADEIDRDYIPRTEHEAEVKRIIEAQGDRRNGCGPYAHHIMKTYAEASEMPMEKESITEWLDRWFIKRPYPKVLDADGVEIKVGDTVYNVNSGVCVPVIEITSNRRVKWRNSGGGTGFWEPEKCTHERPVFDADGVRICNGDTVWHAYTSQEATVTALYRDDKKTVEVEICGHLMDYEPQDLTHRVPDSLEKLRDDIHKRIAAVPVSLSESLFLQACKDRLTALIERGA